MNEFFYMVYVEGEGATTYKHESKEKAEKEAKRLSEKLGKEAYILESIASILCEKDINIKVDSFEKACKYLNTEKDIAVCGSDNKHHKAMVAILKLVTIAEAWNKANNFVPDYSDTNQYKWIPWFKYLGASAGFACAYASYAASSAGTYFGSRLCFKTRELAEQFGKQFIDLWNEFLLIK